MKETGSREKDDRVINEIHNYLDNNKLDAFIPSKIAHIGYLLNFYDILHMNITWEEIIFMLIIPLESDTFIVGGIEDFAGEPEFGVSPWWLLERYGGSRSYEKTLKNIVKIFKKKGLDKGRIGIEYKWIPVPIYNYLSSELPNVEFVSADLLIPQIRFIKTKREQMIITKASNIGIRCMEVYMNAIRSGATRFEAESIRAKCAIDYGGEWWGGSRRLNWAGGSEYTPAWWDPTALKKFISTNNIRNYKKVSDNFPFYITHFETIFQYYWADLAWHEYFGAEPEDNEIFLWNDKKVTYQESKKDFEIIRYIQKESLQKILPGMDHLQAKKAVDNFIKSDSEFLNCVYQYLIHGVGLEVHEEPILIFYEEPPETRQLHPSPVPRDGLILFYPGAVVCSEWLTSMWTVEEPFVMTEKGWEPLVELRGIIDPIAIIK